MFEELNKHRAAVAEQIQKACEIGFTGNELEKAHKVGDVHPNGKWVWTQLPSGRYDWRVIKKTGGGSASAAPATAQKTAQSERKDNDSKSTSDEHNEFVNILKKTPNERYFEQMDDAQLKRFRDTANQYWLSDGLNQRTRVQCRDWRDKAKEEIAYRSSHKNGDDGFEKFAEEYEKKYRMEHSGVPAKSSEIRQEALKEWNKKKGDDKTGSVDYEIGGKITSKNFDSFAKLVNSKKNNFYVVDTLGGRRHKGGRMTSVASDSRGNVKIRIHWMGNGENEKKEFYSKDQAAYWLNGLDFDVEKKKQ